MDAGNEVVAEVELLQMRQHLNAFCAPENIALQQRMLLNAKYTLGQEPAATHEKHSTAQFLWSCLRG